MRARLAGSCLPVEVQDSTPAGIPSAVLIALLSQPGGPQVILTRRAAHLRNHAAEISLPGGRIEPSDEGPAAAALRETWEEIGLSPEKVEILGCLKAYRTISDYCVYPFVGWVDPPVEFVCDFREVAEVFMVPLAFVLEPANHHRDSLMYQGKRRGFYVLPYSDYRIWGATARILVTLARTLNGTP